jgi:hypothetical protein
MALIAGLIGGGALLTGAGLGAGQLSGAEGPDFGDIDKFAVRSDRGPAELENALLFQAGLPKKANRIRQSIFRAQALSQSGNIADAQILIGAINNELSGVGKKLTRNANGAKGRFPFANATRMGGIGPGQLAIDENGRVQVQLSGELGDRLTSLRETTGQIAANRAAGFLQLSELADFEGIEERQRQLLLSRLDEAIQERSKSVIETAAKTGQSATGQLGQIEKEGLQLSSEINNREAMANAIALISGRTSAIQTALNPTMSQAALPFSQLSSGSAQNALNTGSQFATAISEFDLAQRQSMANLAFSTGAGIADMATALATGEKSNVLQSALGAGGNNVDLRTIPGAGQSTSQPGSVQRRSP